LTQVYEAARAKPKRVIFAEAEEDVVLRAAVQFKQDGYGVPILIGRDAKVIEKLIGLGANPDEYEIHNSVQSPLIEKMVDRLYARLQRRGYLRRDVQRMVNRDRNIFGALLLKMDQADAMITGVTRTFSQTLGELRRVLDPKKGEIPFGIHVMVGKTHTVFIADTTVNERPSAEELAHIAEKTAAVARRMGHVPRVAFLSFSTFGNPHGNWIANIREAVALLDSRKPDFEFEGDMPPDVALNPALMKKYPFCRLSGPANVLVMPGLQSANLSAKLLRELGGDQVIGPMLIGMERPVQVATMASSTSDLVTLAVLAAAGVAE
jgi:malate dehydrogenase (oxaloacetate-decarboxylating)(NADP+)